MARFAIRAALFAVSALAAATGCGALLGLHEKELGDLDAAASGDGALPDGALPDGTFPDGTLPDGAPADGLPGFDAPPSNCKFDSLGFGDVQSPSCWTTFDLKQATSNPAGVGGSEGTAFDGRYLYVAPQPGAIVFRYDTTAAFQDPGAWSNFDVQAKLGFLPRFSGALFDGRYVTMVPRDNSPLVVRYDTTAPFGDAKSWSTFDPTPLNANAIGYAGATFDGRYDYFVPRDKLFLLRHDTQPPNDTGGWEIFDVHAVQAGTLTAFWGGVFDGRSVYLAPEGDGVVVRYDTTQPFATGGSWSRFDTATLHPSGLTFLGGAFDGRYVFMGPAGSDSFVARFDTQGTFGDPGAWVLFDMGTLSPSLGLFSGVAFDGRFAYFAPVGMTNFKPNLLMVRYDVTKPFSDGASWTVIDTSQFGAGPFDGSAFDGRFVYFTPDHNSKVARFEARKTPQKLTLPGFFGSFF